MLRGRKVTLRGRLKATLVPLFVTAMTGAAFAATPASGGADAEKTAKVGEAFSILHAVAQWAVDLSKLADERAKSDLVKNYAHEVATQNTDKDAKLMAAAEKHGIEVAPLDPKSEEGKSLLSRMSGEKALLSSLEGDAFDKEYMTLVTNTQQSVIHFLEAHKAAATDPDVKAVLGEMTAKVQARVKEAQAVMAKVYGNKI
jgi:predicted outer membrane protein